MEHPRTNWAGNVVYGAQRFHRPSTVDELRGIVAQAGRVRVVGTGHSFSRIGDTGGDLIFTGGLPAVYETGDGTVTVSGGMRLGELAQRLHADGRALANLPSLPHISVAGAIATGTHGSGTTNLAGFVRSARVVSAGGALVELGPQAALSVGLCGVITELTLATVPAFELRQWVYEDLPWERAGEALGSAYSVSLFTGFNGSRSIAQVWRKGNDDWDGARPADGPRHMIAGMDPANCTRQLGVPGEWFDRLPHFRLTHLPSSEGDELQSEYFVPLEMLDEALEALRRLDFGASLQIAELRVVKADDLWLSTAFQRDSLALHFTWVRDEAVVLPVLAALEKALRPFDPRPHWGKLSIAAGVFPGMDGLLDLAKTVDPEGKFGFEK
jgi:xylitol oxidase